MQVFAPKVREFFQIPARIKVLLVPDRPPPPRPPGWRAATPKPPGEPPNCGVWGDGAPRLRRGAWGAAAPRGWMYVWDKQDDKSRKMGSIAPNPC